MTQSCNALERKCLTQQNRFTIDEVGFIQLATSRVLVAVARGELNLNQLAREEMASRGQDKMGFG